MKVGDRVVRVKGSYSSIELYEPVVITEIENDHYFSWEGCPQKYNLCYELGDFMLAEIWESPLYQALRED